MSRIENEVLNYESKYEKGGVLDNTLGIENDSSLNKAERMITSFKLAKLYLNPGKQSFDIEHYLSIHKFLFEDIYPFAGEIRDENISKSIPFCRPEFIAQELKRVLKIAMKLVPTITSREKLLKYVTELYSDLDVIHPFREGNGRTEREFMRQLIDYICQKNNLEPYNLDYSAIKDRDKYIDAVVKTDAYLDYTDLMLLFDEILIIKEENLELEQASGLKR